MRGSRLQKAADCAPRGKFGSKGRGVGRAAGRQGNPIKARRRFRGLPDRFRIQLDCAARQSAVVEHGVGFSLRGALRGRQNGQGLRIGR